MKNEDLLTVLDAYLSSNQGRNAHCLHESTLDMIVLWYEDFEEGATNKDLDFIFNQPMEDHRYTSLF